MYNRHISYEKIVCFNIMSSHFGIRVHYQFLKYRYFKAGGDMGQDPEGTVAKSLIFASFFPPVNSNVILGKKYVL